MGCFYTAFREEFEKFMNMFLFILFLSSKKDVISLVVWVSYAVSVKYLAYY